MVDLLIKVKLFVKQIPLIYVPYYYISKCKITPKRHLVNNEKDLCLEGYPSSATSFLTVILQHTRPDIKIAHHTHSLANVRLALKYNLPVIVTIRNPIDAVASSIVRFDEQNKVKNFNEYIIRYINWYSYISKKRDSIIVIPFALIVNNLKMTLKIISKYSGIDFSTKGLKKTEEETMIYMKVWNHEYGQEGKISLPNEERKEAKKIVIKKLNKYGNIHKAESIYNNIIEIINKKYNIN